MRTLFLDAFSQNSLEKRPVWLMRQAGRFLPEYMDLRSRKSLFSCFHEPELAVQITHMPLSRFDLDAAIVFSDILLLAEVWGKKVCYPEGKAPYITPPLRDATELYVPSLEEIQEKLFYVFATISSLVPSLKVPLIGFCGAPFTLLCYLLEPRGVQGFEQVRVWIDHRREEFVQMLEIVSKTCISFAALQIQAGCKAFQVFDSWANLLSQEEFSTFVLPYWKQMKDALEPLQAPILFFSRANSLFIDTISSINFSGISFDEGKSLSEIRSKVPAHIVVQGNFSPTFLLEKSEAEVRKATQEMKTSVQGRDKIIWNLGHGVLPKTPLENVYAFLEELRS
jgi:uroporphyrinogen decarboxylase